MRRSVRMEGEDDIADFDSGAEVDYGSCANCSRAILYGLDVFLSVSSFAFCRMEEVAPTVDLFY